MNNEQMQSGAVMSEQEFIKLATTSRPEERAELLDKMREAVEAAKG